MDPWTTYWWNQAVQQQTPQAHNQQLFFTPAGGSVPLPGGYWDANAWKPQWVPNIIPGTHQLVDGFRSRKYPELHPTLAIDTSLVKYDVRFEPQDGITNNAYPANRVAFALARPAKKMRLISKDFPWQLEINQTSHYPITCENIWAGLHAMLQEPLADSEWALVVLGFGDRRKREAIERAAERRRDKARARGDSKGAKDKALKRIDFLGEDVIFRGLEKDDDFAKKRLFPTEPECAETWIVRMGSS